MWVADLHAGPTDSIYGGKLNEIVVTGARGSVDARHIPMTVTTLTRGMLTKENRMSVLPTLMEQVPGLMITSRGMMGYGVSTGSAGGMMMRGLSSGTGQVMVLIDGHPQYQGIFGHSIADSYQTMAVERVEVVRSPASLLYGSNAMGGVINLITRKNYVDGVNTDVILGAGSYGTVQAEACNQVRSGKFNSTVAAQYGRSDNHRRDMGFEQYGGYVKLGYDINDNFDIYADLNLTHFNASNPGSVTQPKLENDQWITRGAASLVLSNHFDGTSGAIHIYDNFGRHKINDGYNVGGTPQTDLFRSKDAVAGVSIYQNVSPFEGNTTTFGFDYQHIYGHAYYTDRATNQVVTTPQRLMQSCHSHENEVAGYIDIRQDIADILTLDAGIRYDHHSQAGGEWVPAAGIVVRPVNNGEVKLAVSKGFRNPTPKEMFLYKPANDSLNAERMTTYELSWKQRLLDGRLKYGISFFLNDGKNIIQTIAMKNVNSGDFLHRGVELEASYVVSDHLALNTNHSYLHMHNPLVAAPEYKGFIGANYRQDRWTANAGLQYVAGLYTSVGATETKENFCLLNLSLSYQLTDNLNLWARGENLLAQEYEINLGYPMPRATFMGGVKVNF
ncbi:MAG: TonB-dependent receptor [Bacteroidaceae bacterium]|nr:TonB-dependent receptor [Bacteroidaceae bacterium]